MPFQTKTKDSGASHPGLPRNPGPDTEQSDSRPGSLLFKTRMRTPPRPYPLSF